MGHAMTLAELKAIHAAMTPGEWQQWADHTAVFARVRHNTRQSIGGTEIARCEPDDFNKGEDAAEDEAKANARGIVALHNHFAALMERYEAMRAALRRVVGCYDIDDGGPGPDTVDACRAALTNADKPLEAAS